MITIDLVWVVAAAFLIGVAVLQLRERRWRAAAFWAIAAVPFVAGGRILTAGQAGTHWPAQAMGVGVIALAVVAPSRAPHVEDDADTRAERDASAARLGSWLFAPALLIPLITVVIFLAVKLVPGAASVIDPAQSTLIALCVASLVAVAVALYVTRSHPSAALTEGRRLLDVVGWAALLPAMLAMLGEIFAKTGVGDAISASVGAVLPTERPYVCVLAYALGMVAFTAIMGNAFAAFPVMTAGIGLPLLVARHGANPAALGAIGMVTGYCGTLLTPMAANFNIVPAALLELSDEYGVIRAQWPTAVLLIMTNVAIMCFAVFR
jgi:uncharacterized membrane protein